jgi:putative ABC transport system permease protein
MSAKTYDASYDDPKDLMTLVNIKGGVNDANTARLSLAVNEFPEAKIQTQSEFKKNQESFLNGLLNALYGLLGLSVIISLFGVVNTLVLSVFERTRELGMLRAVGMTRRQVRRMIRHESIVTALIGAALGIAVGFFLAILTTQALSDEGIVLAVPWTTLLLFVVLTIVAGILAAVLPARRAARLNVLEALQYE